MEQLSAYPETVRRMVRAIEAQQVELDLLILRTPTGAVRESLTDANIYIMGAVSALKDVC